MGERSIDIAFAVIAPREVEFFLAVADELRRISGDISIAFITFYEPGDRLIKRRGYSLFSLHKERDVVRSFSEEDVTRIKQKYGINNIRSLLLHEKYTFGRYDEDSLIKKLVSYDRYFEKILSEHKIKLVAQELGGFIAPMSLFYNCRYKGVNHIFFEPSMYKGRLFFNVNTIDVKLKDVDPSEDDVEFVKQYLENYNREKIVVVPLKDKENFSFGVKRLLQWRFIKRFLGKLYSKYILREREEYDAIFNQVNTHFTMFINGIRQKGLYSSPDYKNDKYVYFPLHVPLDFQLTVRAPKYLNQIALVEYIAAILPYGYKLYIKEHPASVGGYNYCELRRILRQNRNIKLIFPHENSYNLIKNAQEIITINSKVGAEALMQGRRVFVLGKTYYLESENAIEIHDPKELVPYLNGLDSNKRISGENDAIDFFVKVFRNSIEGQLYDLNSENIVKFADALYALLKALD